MQSTTLRQLLPAAVTSMEQNTPSPIRPRKRSTKNTSVACQRCRQYKTKCNGAIPCSACLKKGAKDCIYEAANSREALRQRNESLKRELAQMKGLHSTSEQSESPTPSFSTSLNKPASTSPSRDLSLSIRSAKDSVRSSSIDTVRDSADGSGEIQHRSKQRGPLADILRELANSTTDPTTRNSLLALVNNNPDVPALNATVAATAPVLSRQGGADATTHLPFDDEDYTDTTLGHDYLHQPLHPYAQASSSAFGTHSTVTETGFNIAASVRPNKSIANDFSSFRPIEPENVPSTLTSEVEGGVPLEVVNGNIATPADRRAARANQYYQNPSPYSSMSFASGIKANGYPTRVQDTQIDNLSAPSWNVETMWIPEVQIPAGPARWASHSFLEIRTRARWMLQNNAPVESIIGPTSLHAMLDERPRDPDEQVNVSDWAQAFMSHFPHINIPDKVACWAILWRVLRWQACPSPETFEQVPSWCRPSPLETFVPHLPILICLAWPALRRYFVEQAVPVDWVEAVMGSISVSWPHGDNTVFKRDAHGSLVVSDAFEAWINDYSHWSLSKATTRAIAGIDGRALLR